MLLVLVQMGLLIACGFAWKQWAPRHIPALAHRRALTDLVFFILLPALVLDVIWGAPIDKTSLKISLTAFSGLLTAGIVMWSLLRFIKTTPEQKGALMLAAIFPNVTYLGLPVTNQVLGSWSNAIVLQYDLFACTPALMTFGILMAHHFGRAGQQKVHPLKELTKVPPLWAVVIALLLNVLHVPRPELVHHTLTTLSGGVVPLMLIALGMSIRWDSLRLRYLPLLLPVAVITLLLVPVAVFFTGGWFELPADIALAVVLLAAMPTMVFGVVICERYQLDSPLYAAAVTLTTLLSVVTLPLWFHYLPGL